MTPNVAVIAPGAMGAAVGKRLADHGLKVLTSGRIAGFREISVRTRMRGGAERSPTLRRVNYLQEVRVITAPLNAQTD